jgi:hypothetical protein
MADVDMNFTVYDYNKNIMKQWPVLEGEGLENVKKELRNYLENTPAEQYLMMLCREKNDYTLFNFYDTWDDAQFANDVIECFENRELGIVNVEVIDDGVAMEVWVKRPGQMEEADLYYIFPADSMIIEY